MANLLIGLHEPSDGHEVNYNRGDVVHLDFTSYTYGTAQFKEHGRTAVVLNVVGWLKVNPHGMLYEVLVGDEKKVYNEKFFK